MKRLHVTYSAAALISLVLLCLFIRLWSADRAASVIGPTTIRQGGNGVIYVLSDRFLYLHDKNGILLDKIPMNRFGVEQFIGDFWIYKNGDILLRREVPQKLTIAGEAEMFARTGAGKEDCLGTGESILQLCNMATFRCSNFGGPGNVFDRLTNFKLFVDEERELIYLADTIGHKLLLLDAKGTIITEKATGFKFPNQILLAEDGLLYVADTNNHRVVGVRTDRESFGAVGREFKIVHPGNPMMPTWPMAMARMPAGKWWIINASHNMADGIVMMLSEKGAFEKVLSLPGDADPLTLAVVGDKVLIGDPSLMRIYTADQDGSISGDFGSQVLKKDLRELYRKKRFYQLIANTSMVLLFILLVAAFILARVARLQEADAAKGRTALSAFAGGTTGEETGVVRYDYHSLIGPHRVIFAVVTVVLLSLLAFFLLISRGFTDFHMEFFSPALLGHFIISFWMYLHLKRSYVEVSERGITYQGIYLHFHSPWIGVKKITVYGKKSRIVTNYGNFSIGAIEPAGSPTRGWLDIFRRSPLIFQKQLIEKIQKQAPHVKVNISWFVKRQWKKL